MLKYINVHENDELVTFEEEGHVYTYTPTGKPVRKSVTGVVGPHFDTFDAPAIVERYFDSWLGNSRHKNHELAKFLVATSATRAEAHQKVLDYWSTIGADAATAGTKMHLTLELYIQNMPLVLPPGESLPHCVGLYDQFVKDFKPELELMPWRCEFPVVLVVDGVVVVAGMIDYIAVDNTGMFHVFDWKRVDPHKKGRLGESGKNAYHEKKAAGPFSAFEANDYNKYSAQLLAYKWILEKQYGLRVAGCYMVQMHPDMEKAHVCPVNVQLEHAVNDAMMAEILEAAIETANGSVSATLDAAVECAGELVATPPDPTMEFMVNSGSTFGDEDVPVAKAPLVQRTISRPTDASTPEMVD